jgi:proteasome lid subunit RPN8/RPN11
MIGQLTLITEDHLKFLCRRAFQVAPFEACGFIMNDGEIVELPNVAADPRCCFEMSAIHLTNKLSGREQNIIAIWHTHPRGTLEPSTLDLKAIEIGAIWKDWRYLIATKNEVVELNLEELSV